MSAPLVWIVTGVHLTALLIASMYGAHRLWLVWRFHRTRHRAPVAPDRMAVPPRVTVQLPLFNEAAVAERVIEAACAIDWPRDRLQVQVLDDSPPDSPPDSTPDSTDGCAAISRACVERLRREGHDIVRIHRTDRTGYKAGALAHGLETAIGEFVAIFDADFVPPPSFLRDTIDHFTDPAIGLVQASWDHLNADESILTRAQAVLLDAHFRIEHPARDRDGCWFNFNGTAGVWRRTAIDNAGGWSSDTLTEDVDLSYRAQCAGWRFRYLADVTCPAELPATLAAFKTQQHRWTKGTAQTALKLLPRILVADRSVASWRCKREAFMHLTSPIVHPCVIAITLLMYPAIALHLGPFARGTAASVLLGLTIIVLATLSGCAFYAAGQRARGVGWWRTLARLPVVVTLGIGMTVNGTVAVAEALLRRPSPFVRTPKAGLGTIPRSAGRWSLVSAELVLGAYLLVCVGLALRSGLGAVVPFLLLFAVGFLAVGLAGVGAALSRRDVPEAEIANEQPERAAVGGHV